MKSILRVFSLRRTFVMSAVILVLLSVFSFYGPYTGKFYFLKAYNYVFPVLTLIHFVFLYVLWFKVKEDEMTDPQMRNLEYVLYLIFVIYTYKAIESIYILTTYGDYENHLLPKEFLSIGIFIMVLYFLLIGLTLLTIKYRKKRIGNYNFDDMNHIDSWE